VTTYRIEAGRLRATCSTALDRETARRWIEDSAGRLLDASGAAISRAERTAIGGAPVIIKRDARSPAKRLAAFLAGRASRPVRAFRNGMALLQHGVRAARPLLLLEERVIGIPGRAAVVLEEAPGDTLREFITATLPALAPAEREQAGIAALRAIASTVARLHASRFRQRDLKAPNILIDLREDDCLATLIDLEAMTILYGAPTWGGRARDLGRLAASLRTEEARAAGFDEGSWRAFLAAYLEACGEPVEPARARALLRRTIEWAEKKEERNRRMGRVLH
jgi:hypothetical protein